MLPQKVVVFLEKEFCIRFEGITMTVSRFSKVEDETPWGIQSHAHLNFEMHYIFDGRGSITLGHTGFEIGKGEYYICPPFIDHDQKTDDKDPMKEFCVECKLEVDDAGEENGSAAYGQLLNKLFYGKYSDHDGYILKCFQLMDSILTSNDGKMRVEDETILKSLLMNVAISMLFFTRNDSESAMSRQDWNDINYHRATSIRNYLEANYKNDISVRDCTKIFFLSERQIDRIPNKVFHESFYSLLMKTRVNIAMNLIKTTNLPIEYIAAEVGFTGYRQMLRCFKKFNIENPTVLRRQCSRSDSETRV